MTLEELFGIAALVVSRREGQWRIAVELVPAGFTEEVQG
jgi:hypothetical protein